MTMRQALVIHAMLLAVLAFGCAKTPATTSGSAPSPTGSATSGTSGTGSGSDMRAGGGAGSQGTTGSSVRVDPRTYSAAVDLADIHFDFDKYELTADSMKTLDTHAEWLKANPKHLVLIEGHCDERGTDAYNVALGERRAKATQNYLAAHGVRTARITIISYGEERPMCSEHSEECWAKNRRAHFMVKAQ